MASVLCSGPTPRRCWFSRSFSGWRRASPPRAPRGACGERLGCLSRFMGRELRKPCADLRFASADAHGITGLWQNGATMTRLPAAAEPLRALILEDQPLDAELALRAL